MISTEEQAEGFYMRQYFDLSNAVHQALRQLITGNAEAARNTLVEGLAQAEEAVLVMPETPEAAAEMNRRFNARMEKAMKNEALKNAPRPRRWEESEILEFYKKQYAKLFFAMDKLITFMRQGFSEDAELLLISTLAEAEEAYIQSSAAGMETGQS